MVVKEIPKFALRAYALLYNKYGKKEFTQASLAWVVSTPMRKKIFSILLNFGWIKKVSRRDYVCIEPNKILKGLFEFKVPVILKRAKRKFCYTKMSAVEIWTDFVYIQRGWEHSPYFIKILNKDLEYWKNFLNREEIPFFLDKGSYVGEFIILETCKSLKYTYYNNFPVEKLKEVVKFCQSNLLFEYALAYLKRKFKIKVKVEKRILKKVEEVF